MKHVVGFSGGADSQACALWVRQRYPAKDVILLNSDAGGNEHPITTEFIRQYSETIHPVVMVQAIVADLHGIGKKDGLTRDRRAQYDDDELLTFPMLAEIKGRFPSRTAQFCTEILKLRPSLRWCRDHLSSKGIAFERYSGVRRDESDKRKDTPLCDWDDYFDCIIHCPLATWSKPQVFAFLFDHGEDVNPLYRLGFSRVGCAPCINSGKDDIRNWAARFPGMIDKIRDWETKVGRTFFGPKVPGMEINWIDDYVAWSRTARGGRQPLLQFEEAEAAAGGCSSKYGLCE